MTRLIVLLILAVAAGLAWVFIGRPWFNAGVAGANYIAKGVCSCVFIAGREKDSCMTDYPDDMRRLVSADVINWRTNRTVTIGGETRDISASEQAVETTMLMGLVKARADFTPGAGCQLTPED